MKTAITTVLWGVKLPSLAFDCDAATEACAASFAAAAVSVAWVAAFSSLLRQSLTIFSRQAWSCCGCVSCLGVWWWRGVPWRHRRFWRCGGCCLVDVSSCRVASCLGVSRLGSMALW